MLRDELQSMIELAERLCALDEHVVLATLCSSSGSTYRPLGSMMVSYFPSMFLGGISGGCIERHVARVGRSLTQQEGAAILRYDTDPDADHYDQPALGCGGAIDVLVERLTADHIEFMRQVHIAMCADVESVAACVIDTSITPMRVSRHWLGGSPPLSDGARLEIWRQRCLSDKQSRHGVLDATGSRRVLVHYIRPMTRLVILGAGDDAQPLCMLAHSLGWHVTVVDRRGRLATKARFPNADEIVGIDWATALPAIRFDPNTAVVMMTHGLPDDIAILPHLVDGSMFYLGMLGPAHRLEWVVKGARENTRLDNSFVSKIRSPVGLNLGDRTSHGIAVSIVAEILACLNERDARPLSQASVRMGIQSGHNIGLAYA
jgi:xanthine/CO dehydrogenase XdhC/CoxF family maturation factor